MKPPRGVAAFILLISLFQALPSRALPKPVIGPPAMNHEIAAVLQHPTSRGSPRERLIQRLAVPDTAIIILATGVLLIFLECNLPAAILPGALGLLLVLSGIFGLALHPLRPAALLLLLAAGALLGFSARGPLPLVNALAGTAGLICGLLTLIPPASATSSVHLPVAACVGLAIGPSAFLLLSIAERARRNKIIPAAKSHVSPTNARS